LLPTPAGQRVSRQSYLRPTYTGQVVRYFCAISRSCCLIPGNGLSYLRGANMRGGIDSFPSFYLSKVTVHRKTTRLPAKVKAIWEIARLNAAFSYLGKFFSECFKLDCVIFSRLCLVLIHWVSWRNCYFCAVSCPFFY
jgi:hypothetical protein